MNTRSLTIAIVTSLTLFALRSTAAPGDVDRTFDPGSRLNDFVYAVAGQPDGKVVVGGLFTSPRTLIARLNADGSTDTNFNVGTGANGIIYSIALQPDGKIIIGGAFSRINGTTRNRIARLNADGSLDLTFNPGTGADGRIRSVALLSSGKILVAGDFFTINDINRVRIARLNADGSLDAGFNPGVGADEEVFSVVAQADGKVLIGGYFLNVNDTPRSYVARLNANGTVDLNYDPGAGADLDVDAIVLQSDGKAIIGGGFSTYNGFSRSRIARLHTDGSLDETFDPGSGVDYHVGSLALQADGKVIVSGNFGTVGNALRSNVARLNSNGSVDPTFDPPGGTDAIIHSVATQVGGKIVCGGAFKLANGVTRNYVARFNGDGTLDNGFNPSTGADYPVLSIAAAPAGKVLVGGYLTVINNISRHYVARLNEDGTVDTSFDPGSGANNRVTAVVPQTNGKVIVGGLFTSFNGTNRNRIARLNGNGGLDTTFAPGGGANGDITCVSVHEGGSIVVGGFFTSYDGTNRNRITRLNANGGLDPTFDPGTGANAEVLTVVAQPDGKVLLGGEFTVVHGTNRNHIARLNTDGTIDTDFNPGAGANGTVESLALQPDGKVVVAGQFTAINGTNRNRIARLNANGGLDLTFNPGSGADAFVYSVALQGDGKVVLGGDFLTFGGISRRRIAQLNADGTLDLAFNPGGGANDTVTCVAVLPDGRVLLGGFFDTVNEIGRSCVARLEANPPRPTLSVGFSGGSVVLSWPAMFTNFALQSNLDLKLKDDWTDVAITPLLNADRWVVTNTVAAGTRLFRLKKP